jgi:uncharacterized membrane protein YjgN (DUF898 family)
MSQADPSDAAPPADLPPAAPPNGACFLGPEPAFWRLLIRGALLLLVTLGIYRFWLATDVRRYLWNHTEIAGDMLEYVGTARELLIGFLIAIAFLVPIYAVFYLGAFAKGLLGQFASVLAFAGLALLGQFAVYRARRYRLARTVYRGIRFHQKGSAWRYAVCATFWWAVIGISLGLAYPFAQASLERFKLRNTFYGDLQGDFVGSGMWLFVRGFLYWLVVIGPFVLGLMVAIGAVDWDAVGEALKSGAEGMSRIESAGAGQAAAIAVLSLGWSVVAVAVLYPAFQAMVLRWWISGLRFGALTVTSRLRTRAVYALYVRFVWMALLAGVALAVLGAIAFAVLLVLESLGEKAAKELLQVAVLVGIYVFAALAYSTVYQATVKLRLWKESFAAIELAGVEVLDRVKAQPATGSPVGEGFADALNVGGI